MYHTTGFSKDQILDLCSRAHSHTAEMQTQPWPPILGLYRAVVVTLTYLRRNESIQGWGLTCGFGVGGDAPGWGA